MRIRRNGYKIRLPGRIAVQGAPPLDIFHPTRQKRALGTPDRAELVGWLDQHLLARFARLARYAVAQRVQNSRFGPHNGLSPGSGPQDGRDDRRASESPASPTKAAPFLWASRRRTGSSWLV